MPSKKCEHGRPKTRCKPCGGGAICVHNKIRCECRECGNGNYFCKHNRRKYDCTMCVGSLVCSHGRRKSTCKVCKGSQLCGHDRLRDNCSKCNPLSVYKRYKRAANHRSISFQLTFDEFKLIIASSCSYCGESQEPVGCDRIDSKKGYLFSNCQPLCIVCNRMKLDYSEEMFFKHILKVIDYSGAKYAG